MTDSAHAGTGNILTATGVYQTALSCGIPVDPVILQTVLLCLVAGQKHLILRTTEDDIGLAAKLVVLTLSTIFGLRTHRSRIHAPASNDRKHPSRQSHDPAAFLRTILLPSSSTSTEEGGRQSFLHQRTSTSEATASPILPLRRSQTQPVIVSDSSPVTRISHAYSDPSPGLQNVRNRGSSANIQLPDAIVTSGLEHANVSSQLALAQAFLEQKVDFSEAEDDILDAGETTVNLPSTFFAVYICRSDERQYPTIHKTLLDKFAASGTVVLSPQLKASATTYFANVRSPGSALQTPSSPLATPSSIGRTMPSSYFANHAQAMEHPLAADALNVLRESYLKTYISPTLSVYLNDLFSAARHHYLLDAQLLTARAKRDAEDLARAWRVVNGDSTGRELIEWQASLFKSRPPTAENDEEDEEQHSFEMVSSDGGSSKEMSALHIPPRLETLDLSESDVARTFPRVISHRVQIREARNQTMFNVLYRAGSGHGRPDVVKDVNSTVKAVIVQILGNV